MVYDDKAKLDSLVTTKWKKLGYFKQIELKNLIHKMGVFSFGNVTQMTEFVDKEINKYLSIASYTIILMMPFVSLLLLIFFRKKAQKTIRTPDSFIAFTFNDIPVYQYFDGNILNHRAKCFVLGVVHTFCYWIGRVFYHF
ncbi:hypothetical protein QIU18_08320 [Capnocytophaga canimorsus]|nr:hypothetical protein [Capnocytophaga canimorsus]WGU69674.1 hypothetical protein QIU18_08320 [Capnocytophaga canimorsus]